MSVHESPLDNLKVAAPCAADWGRMRGDDRVRFCAQCSLNVYNLSGMTRAEAEALVTNTEGRLCVRFYRRADGTLLTENCPVGLRAIKRRVSRVAGAALSAAFGFLAGLGVNFSLGEMGGGELPPYRHTMGAMIAREPARSAPPAPPLGTSDGRGGENHAVMGVVAADVDAYRLPEIRAVPLDRMEKVEGRTKRKK